MPSSRTLAHDFFDTHLVPNHEVWLVQPTDIRLAMNAVVSLYHMADHFWHAYNQTNPNLTFQTRNSALFRAALATRDNHFAVLRDVAEAHKHMKLDRPARILTDSTQSGIGSTGWSEVGYGIGPYGGGPSIIVHLNDNSKYHLSFLAQEVQKLWLFMLA